MDNQKTKVIIKPINWSLYTKGLKELTRSLSLLTCVIPDLEVSILDISKEEWRVNIVTPKCEKCKLDKEECKGCLLGDLAKPR